MAQIPFRTYRVACFVLLLALVQSCADSGDTLSQQGSAVIGVDYALARPRKMADVIEVTGSLIPAESAMLTAQTAGKVQELYFDEGQQVQKNQLLVRLDLRQWKAQVASLEAELSNAKKDLERKRRLVDIQGITQEALDQAQLAVTTLENSLQEARVKVDYAEIRAPFSGVIGLRSVSPGSYLSPGSTVAQLVKLDPLKIEFNVPEQYASGVKQGDIVLFTMNGSQEQHRAKVYATDAAIDPSTRALRVRAEVPNPDQSLIPGAFAEITLVLDTLPNALMVPTEAVVPELNRQTVFRLKNGKVEKRLVETGIRTPTMVQLTSGVEPNDTILVSGLLQVREGMPARADSLVDLEPLPSQTVL